MKAAIIAAGRGERLVATRREGKIGLKQPFEFEKWLVIEGNVVHVTPPDTGLLQAVRNGIVRITGIVFLAREPLFLGGGHDLAILD